MNITFNTYFQTYLCLKISIVSMLAKQTYQTETAYLFESLLINKVEQVVFGQLDLFL